MEIEVLGDLGLTQGEIKVYLALLELGSSTAGLILEKAKIQNSVLHFCLNKLIERGLVKYIKRGKVRVYQAVGPENFIEFIENKRRAFLKILPELKAKQILVKERQSAEIFEGTAGIMTMLDILIEDTKPGEEYLFFAVNSEEFNEEIRKLFRKYDSKRKDRGLVIKGLAPKTLKYLFNDRKGLQMKYANFPMLSNISICDNKIAISSFGEKPVGYLIRSKQIAKIFTDFFNNLWSITKK